MNVLTIQSHVVYGRVGNRSAVFPLERMGIEAWPINTVQYSTNTGKPGWTGAAFGADHVSDIVAGLDALGVLASCDAVISGYIGDTDTGMAILDAVSRVKARNPSALYCCDPVMGDHPGGLYVKPELQAFFRERALPQADIAVPNVFEAENLSGVGRIDGREAASRAIGIIHRLGPRVVVMTSYRPAGQGTVGFFLSEGGLRHELSTPALAFAEPVKGSGDLFGALFLGNYLKSGSASLALESAAGSLYAVLEATLASGGSELAMLGVQDRIARPPRRFAARPVLG